MWERPDRIEAELKNELTESTDPNDPTDPMDRMEPAEPMDRIEPADPIDRMDPVDPMLRMDPAEPREAFVCLCRIGPLFQARHMRLRAGDPMRAELPDLGGYRSRSGYAGVGCVGRKVTVWAGQWTVDFELNDEQRLFRQTLRDFADKEIVPVAAELERSGTYPAHIVAKLKELGLFGLNVPEEYGGLGADRVCYALAFEEIARAWLGAAGLFGPHSVACWLIARNGTGDQKNRYLPAMASGDLRSGIALTEPGAGTDLQGIATTAVRDGDEYVVSGTKTWITNARVAGVLPVLVKTTKAAKAHQGMSVLLVDTDSDGFTVSRDLPKLGYKGPETCELVLDQVRVPAANLLGGDEGRGLQQILNGLEIGRINIAARAVGVAQAAYDAALGYARERRAFGRPIADFQAIQLKLADMATEIQAARLLTYWAAVRSQASDGRVDMEAGMAKMYASEVALKCALESMRIHGAYGYSAEFIVERLYRDAPLMAIGEGTNDIQRMVIARSLVSGAGRLGW